MGVTKNFELLAFRDFLKRLLLPALGKGRDTQCGFKAFKASVVKKVIPSVTDRKYALPLGDVAGWCARALRCNF